MKRTYAVTVLVQVEAGTASELRDAVRTLREFALAPNASRSGGATWLATAASRATVRPVSARRGPR